MLFLSLFTLIIVANGIGKDATKARIKIDVERQVGEIDPIIYGNFIEHLGRCIYGGIYEPDSPHADEEGFRKDVLQAAKELNVTILRWPGGNFVSGYHWEDGIGPREKRPRRIDLAWGAIENNHIGTDEYIRFCRKLGTEPYICINLGTGTWDEARNWVEYCNRESGTYYTDLRQKNGFEKPHKVIYWALGNEMDGDWQMGHRDAEDYAKYALEAAKMMKWIDPDIKLVGCGSSNFGGDWIGWNRTVLNILKNHIDYIALHTYLGDRDNNYYKFMANPTHVDRNIEIVEGLIRETLTRTRRQTPIYIAYDEWNVWYRAGGREQLEETYDLQDALVVAQFLNAFVRHAHIVKIANMAQLVNVIAPIRTTTDDLWRQTIYFPLQLFAQNCYGTALEVFVDCAVYEADHFKNIPYLDVSAAFNNQSDELVLNVVNRHQEQTIATTIVSQFGEFADAGVARIVNGPEVKVVNTRQEQPVKIATQEVQAKGQELKFNFAPHSFTQIIIGLKK